MNSFTNNDNSAEASGGAGAMTLGTDCTIREAPELHRRLLALLEGPRPVMLDATDVDRIDAAGVQLLAGFTVECMERGIPFGWRGRSPAFERAVHLLGIGALLESPGVAAYPGAI